MLQNHYRYGNVISVNLAGTRVVVLHGYDTIKEAFNQQQLSGRPRLYTSEKICPGVGEVLRHVLVVEARVKDS